MLGSRRDPIASKIKDPVPKMGTRIPFFFIYPQLSTNGRIAYRV